MEPTSDPRPKEEDQHRCADDQPWNGDRREQQQLQQPLCPELEAREGVGGKRAEKRRDHRVHRGNPHAVPARLHEALIGKERLEPDEVEGERKLVEGNG